MSSTAQWYVVHTYSSYEDKVARDIKNAVENRKLGDLIQEVAVPTETYITKNKDGKDVESERKLFPGYVYIKMVMTDDTWYIIRNIRGVTGFVGPGSKPIPLSEDEVTALSVAKTVRKYDVEVGDYVKTDNGLDGKISELDEESGRVKIITNYFGQEAVVEFNIDQVKKLD